MSNERRMRIDVAGDVCLDLVGIPEPPPPATVSVRNNWQLTGETRTHYLLGGALLLADWVRAAVPDADLQATRPCLPESLAKNGSGNKPLSKEAFLQIAERLTRDEVVHSLLELDYFHATPDAKKLEQTRVKHQRGFSGPKSGDPALKLLAPDDASGPPEILVLDDTGNRFRRTPSQWPACVNRSDGGRLVIYKLHRPLPYSANAAALTAAGLTDDAGPDLWQTVASRYPDHRIAIVSIDDIRDLDAPISCGLSWERTALDLVWQLLNVDRFAALRDCPHLIVRFGLNGAMYWSRRLFKAKDQEGKERDEIGYRAWLIYDPLGIEGTMEGTVNGTMVGYGSVFTAALTKHLAEVAPSVRASLGGGGEAIDDCIENGIKAGLLASRRLLRFGFGVKGAAQPNYPGAELFTKTGDKDDQFACQAVPIIPLAATPDRGYWRLLETIFENKTALLHRAVALTATGAKPVEKDDREAARRLRQVPMAVYKGLRTYDRREIENYRALYSLLLDYICQPTPPRPLSIAVFGPPGAGKSFGVKMVAKALGDGGSRRPIETLTFNLSQYQDPNQLADAFHLVRDVALRGKIPLVFFDEFDTSLGGVPHGWLRYFLAPMQDAEFLDRGVPHPIGQAIFVFAGGTCATYAEFAKPFLDHSLEAKVQDAFKSAKGPDFLSRLRGTLDIPGLDLNKPFDPYGPVDAFPCESAILLRRAGILAYQLNEKAPRLRDSSGTLLVSAPVLRALLHLPQFTHGNRSFEAILDMSRLSESKKFNPASLAAPMHVELHADLSHLTQFLGTEYPFPPRERDLIAQSIHKEYVEQRAKGNPPPDKNDETMRDWDALPEYYKDSNRRQADDVVVKLRAAGLWFRKQAPGAASLPDVQQRLDTYVEQLAQSEHDRWVAEKRRQGWLAAPCKDRSCRNNVLRLHNFLFRWDELTEETKELDRGPVRDIPKHLAAAGYEVTTS